MATITGLTAERMREIEAASIVDGRIDESGHLILTKYDGTEIDAGDALVAVPNESIVKILDPNGYDGATPGESYPVGVSLLHVSDSIGKGYPFGLSSGTIRSSNIAGDSHIVQMFQAEHGSFQDPQVWVRAYQVGWGWSNWEKLALNKDLTSTNTRVTALENVRTQLLNQGDLGITESSPQSAYPLGVSILSVSTGSGWSRNGGFGAIVTYNHSVSRCVQHFYKNSAANGSNAIGWTRNFHGDNPGWSNWVQIGSDKLIRTSSLTSGNWYRIADFNVGGVNGDGFGKKVSGEFLISTEASGQHHFLRLRATVGYDRAGLIVEESVAYNSPVFTKARIVSLNGTYGGGALELYCSVMVADGRLRVSLKPDEWEGTIVGGWNLLNYNSTPTTPPAPQVVLLQRGIGRTNEWTAPTLLNGWSNLDPVNYGTIAYYMRPGGTVELAGLGKTTNAIDSSGNSPTFILPEGCRPNARKTYASLNGSNGIARIDVYPDGKVSVLIGTLGSESFDGITFLAEK